VTLDKRAASASGRVTVIFRVPPEVAASRAELLGDFTEWSPVAMQPTDDGGHEAAIDLDGGAAYRFRYLLDGERWANDWAADGYIANDYGSDDSVVDLTANGSAAKPKPVKKATKKATKNPPAKRASATRRKSSSPSE
jgi:1,4-alpha-glucan branching enzyme